MKIARKIFISLILVLVVASVASFFLPSELYISRSVHIRASKADVFHVLHNLRRFNEWSPWYKQDPEAAYVFAGPEEGPGSEINWDGEITKQGKMIITRTVPSDSVFIEIYFGKDASSSGEASFYLSEAGRDSTLVSWIFTLNMGMNPLARYMGLAMEGTIATQYEHGLQDLKTLLEHQSAVADIKVELLEIEEQRLIGLRGRFDNRQAAGPSMENAFAALMNRLEEPSDDLNYATMYIGTPDSVGGINYLVGYLSNASDPAAQDLTTEIIAAGTYLSTMHVGPYSQLSQAHAALTQELKSGRYTLIGNPWEQYLIHPKMAPDSTQLRTQIFYPVRVTEASF